MKKYGPKKWIDIPAIDFHPQTDEHYLLNIKGKTIRMRKKK